MRKSSKLFAYFTLAAGMMVGGCFYAELKPKSLEPTAHYRVDGSQMLLRNDDKDAWIDVTVTAQTNTGTYNQPTDDVMTGKVRGLPLSGFKDDTGKPLSGTEIDKVWVRARYPDQRSLNELAYPF